MRKFGSFSREKASRSGEPLLWGLVSGRFKQASTMANELIAASFRASAPSDFVILICRRPVKSHPTSAQASAPQQNTLSSPTPASLQWLKTSDVASGKVAA